jgi:hypothetical protein
MLSIFIEDFLDRPVVELYKIISFMGVRIHSVILLFFLLFLFMMVSLSLLSICCCLSAFSDTTWHESNHHPLPSINQSINQSSTDTHSHYFYNLAGAALPGRHRGCLERGGGGGGTQGFADAAGFVRGGPEYGGCGSGSGRAGRGGCLTAAGHQPEAVQVAV